MLKVIKMGSEYDHSNCLIAWQYIQMGFFLLYNTEWKTGFQVSHFKLLLHLQGSNTIHDSTSKDMLAFGMVFLTYFVYVGGTERTYF